MLIDLFVLAKHKNFGGLNVYEELESERIPEILLPMLGALEELDNIKEQELIEPCRRKRHFRGQYLVKNAYERELLRPTLEGPYTLGHTPVNVIPKGRPGDCAEILLVFVGERDNIEIRILEAIEHCAALCRGLTSYVIFYTMKWHDRIWNTIKYHSS